MRGCMTVTMAVMYLFRWVEVVLHLPWRLELEGSGLAYCGINQRMYELRRQL